MLNNKPWQQYLSNENLCVYLVVIKFVINQMITLQKKKNFEEFERDPYVLQKDCCNLRNR